MRRVSLQNNTSELDEVKDLVDDLVEAPSKLSQLENDVGYATEFYVNETITDKIPKNITVKSEKTDFALDMIIRRGDVLAFKLLEDTSGYTGYIAQILEENTDNQYVFFYTNNGEGMSAGYG